MWGDAIGAIEPVPDMRLLYVTANGFCQGSLASNDIDSFLKCVFHGDRIKHLFSVCQYSCC